MSSDNHSEDHDENVDEDSQVGQPTKLLQCSNLAKDHTNNDQDDDADNVAELELGRDGQRETVGNGDQGDRQDEL